MPTLRKLGAVFVAGVLCVGIVACGGDYTDIAKNIDPTVFATVVNSTPLVDNEQPPTRNAGQQLADLSGEDVCALNTIEEVAAALDVTVEEAEPSDGGTPSCSYTFTTREGTGNNVVVAVMRVDDDLGGLSGADAFEFAVELNRRFSDDAPEQEVSVGDDALFMDGAAVKLLIVRQGERIMTVAGTTLTLGAATDIAEAAAARL